MTELKRAISFGSFGPRDSLSELGESDPVKYVRRYLNDLGCRIIVEEPVYFDRDYLAEFAAFYCKSTRGYRNFCRRLHFFADPELDHDKFMLAAADDPGALRQLQDTYLGFAVVRPFEPPLLGRTVLAWYPEDPQRPGRRITTPSRDYHVYLAGVRLSVRGLAWQPQDSAVGSCATVSLWSMLHSSAFDDHHAIPTTAAITQSAHKTASLGSRVFPSAGLTTYQLFEAIKAQQLSPVVIEGDVELSASLDRSPGFSRERFLATCVPFVRSGYPVLLWGMLMGRGLHAICVTGLREQPIRSATQTGEIQLHDAHIDVLYVHDDNLGPGVRCRVIEQVTGEVRLIPEAPPPLNGSELFEDPAKYHPGFQPMSMVVAVHEELTLTPDKLHRTGFELAHGVNEALCYLAKSGKMAQQQDISLQTRFVGLRQYLSVELAGLLCPGQLLARVRLELAERAPAMSLHLGIVQLSFGNQVMLQILFDTTDNEHYLRAFAHIAFHPVFARIVPHIAHKLDLDIGVDIRAYQQASQP
jgi:hypothetical protein